MTVLDTPITETLKTELVLARKLLALVEEKGASIRSNDLERLESLYAEEQEAISQLEEVGFSRQEQVLTLTRSTPGLRVTESLKDYISQLPEPDFSRLMPIRQDLLGVYEKIAFVNRLNAEMLQQNIRVTKHLFDRYKSIDSRFRQPNYSGKTPKAKPKSGSDSVFSSEG